MKIITWNLNSRTNLETLNKQCDYLKEQDLDLMTLQEVTLNSQEFFKDYFKNWNVLSSFDFVSDKSVLVKKRKYGQLIISKDPITPIEPFSSMPFPERLLSGHIKNKNIEIHTTHVPPGSSNGVIKVQHFEELYKFLAKRKDIQKILTGDFNSPKLELETGEIITWGQKVSSSGKVRIAVNPKWKNECSGERWDSAERNIIQNHKSLGLVDMFRAKNGYMDNSGSWFTNKGVARRYDHIFGSTGISILGSHYDQKPREQKYSDHSPLIVECNIL
tara:strand:- start:867 stop:1688 length:822 start_codon:yes stop_codon:yes gene_type:complete